MRYSLILMAITLVILLMVTAGCVAAPRNGPLTNATETTAQPASVVTTAEPASTPVITVTTGTKCPSVQTACADGTCRDTTSDHDACGGCGNVCPAGYVCKASACINPAGTTAAATPVTTSPNNPVTTTVLTTIPTPISTYRYIGSFGSDFQLVTVAETTYPPNTQYIDCSKYPMSITSISPASGSKSGGTNITIHGSGFMRGAYTHVDVKVGNTYSPVTPVSDTTIAFATPSGTSGFAEVRVVAGFTGVSNSCLSPVTNASHFIYV
jgi:hypothetical protein